jgi:hypothetical protein
VPAETIPRNAGVALSPGALIFRSILESFGCITSDKPK